MKIVFSDKIKKDILFTLTKALPSVFIVYQAIKRKPRPSGRG